MRVRQLGIGLTVCAFALYLYGFSQGAADRGAGGVSKPASGAVAIQMKNVSFRFADDIALEVRSLRGNLEPTHAGEPVVFDDTSSFKVAVDSAEVAVTPASITALMNSYVLAYPGAPIRNVTMTI